MAHKVISELTGEVDSADSGELMAAIELAANESAYNIPELPGTTAIFVDDSGSMQQPVSGKSKVDCAMAARALGAIVAKRGERVYLNAFSDEVREVKFSKNDTVVGIANRIPFTCQGTYGYKCIEWLARKGIKADRVILMSDQQCYEDRYERSMCDVWQKYRKQNPTVWLHSIHLNGSGDTPIKEGDRVNLIGGFSQRVITMLLQTEGVLAKDGKVALPTVEQIRAGWTVSSVVPVAPAKEEAADANPDEE
jgi:hypothetical protein